ncbi:HNH endonuclease [Mycolicibacterium austroafricanum]|nr:HNH endonuclease [Mycolicibacterium austroafricanum]
MVVDGRMIYHLKPLTKDHMVPLSRGGSDSIDNIVGACVECNTRKHMMTAEEFLPTTATIRRLSKALREQAQEDARTGAIDFVALAHTAIKVIYG